MCYPKPGPRCSKHAKDRLDLTSNNLKEALEAEPKNHQTLLTAIEEQKSALSDFYATPAGSKTLRKAIADGKDENGELAYELKHGIERRERALNDLREQEAKKSIEANDAFSTDLPQYAKLMPGFAKEWNNHFKDLVAAEESGEEIEPLSPVSLLTSVPEPIRLRGSWIVSRSEFINEFCDGEDNGQTSSDYLVLVHTRQGGGNRECYCDVEADDSPTGHNEGCLAYNNEQLENHRNYLTDKDDDFDSTYANFVFDNNIDEEQMGAYQAKDTEMRALYSKKNIRDAIKRGEIPPWYIRKTVNPVTLSEYRQAKQELDSLEANVPSARTNIIAADELIAKLKDGTATVEDFNKVKNLRLPYSSAASSIIENYRDYTKKSEELAKLERSYKEAEAMPADSPLREYLIGDRGTGSYNTTEKQGRRNVTVKKTYNKGSVLGNDLENAKRYFESAKSRISLDKIQEAKKESEATVKNYQEQQAKIKTLRDRAWNNGKRVSEKAIIPPPDSF